MKTKQKKSWILYFVSDRYLIVYCIGTITQQLKMARAMVEKSRESKSHRNQVANEILDDAYIDI